jgi:hypothetical protein
MFALQRECRHIPQNLEHGDNLGSSAAEAPKKKCLFSGKGCIAMFISKSRELVRVEKTSWPASGEV